MSEAVHLLHILDQQQVGEMEDEVLKDILDYATKKLNSAYGYCGVAEGQTAAMLNSDDGNGRDIKITIKLEEDA